MATEEASGTKMTKEKSDVIWISHRGYCGAGATENTENSFNAAIKLGFKALETDLRLSQDGVIVLHHDDNLDRTFTSSERVSTLPYKELQTLRSKDGQSIMTLDRLYELYSSYRWIFDIKPPNDHETLKALQIWASSEDRVKWLERNVRFLLWSGASEKECLRLFPKNECLARERECYRAGLFSLLGLGWLGGIQKGRTYSLPPRFAGRDLFTARLLREYHQRGARLLAYLPPSEDLAKKAWELGFDEILTNGFRAFPGGESTQRG